MGCVAASCSSPGELRAGAHFTPATYSLVFRCVLSFRASRVLSSLAPSCVDCTVKLYFIDPGADIRFMCRSESDHVRYSLAHGGLTAERAR